MTEPENQHSLVDELDARQNAVLLELDDLNTQIEFLLENYLGLQTATQEAA